MTGYYLEVGYNSDHDREEVWREMVKAVKKIRNDSELIYQEAVKFDATGCCDRDELLEYAKHYKDCDDLTIRIKEEPNPKMPEEKRRYIQQYASGYGPQRDVKEHLRRAFCRLVLYEMHKKGMEINLIVA